MLTYGCLIQVDEDCTIYDLQTVQSLLSLFRCIPGHEPTGPRIKRELLLMLPIPQASQPPAARPPIPPADIPQTFPRPSPQST